MKNFIFALVVLALSGATLAASDSYTAKVSHIRVESTYGFISMEGTLPWAQELNCSSERIWVDLKDEIGKIQYNTALSAMVAGKKLYIRVHTDSTSIVYGACKLYDLVIYSK
ncbi:hypothetical protein [Aliikangiella maris]|uniref:Uncharacterized protein n=2 Tax=Aliikangiella maris TaxID=3162458 RepID=A0ABV2C079_9GAMM